MAVLNLPCDYERIRPLLKLCKFLAMIPDPEMTLQTKIYPLCWIMVLAAVYFYALCGKIVSLYGGIHGSILVTDAAGDIVNFGSQIATIAIMNLNKGANVCTFFKKMKQVDDTLATICVYEKRSRRFITEFVAIHIYFIIYYAYYATTWVSTLGFKIFSLCFIRELLNYNTLMLALLLRNCALAIKCRFEAVNLLLNDDVAVYKGPIKVVEKCDQQYEDVRSCGLTRLRHIYTDLQDMIQDYNYIFGWQFVILYINIIANLLSPINLSLVYGSGENTLYGQVYDARLVVLCVMWASLPVIVAIAIFSACSETTDQVVKTRTTCYVLMKHLHKSDEVVKGELQELIQQSNDAPIFSAAGFYTVNYGVLFSLIGSIGSYILVLVQFRK